MFEGGCEIWVANVSDFLAHQSTLDGILTADERTYVDRQRGVATPARLSRGLLRLLLSGYLDLPPAEVEIDRSCPECGRPHGKPRLVVPPGTEPSALTFSISHGGDLLVLAFAEHTALGVDVEPIGAPDDVPEDLWDFTLTSAERARVRDAPRPLDERTFLRYWTGKEAVLKALGTGLNLEPQAVTLSPTLNEGTASVSLPGSERVALWICDVDVGAKYVCTLAAEEQVSEVRSVRLTPGSVLDRPYD